ncbi:MAG TPA: winged helix-turn-helix domain-containing protein [Phenylobacterium sp.]|nr:winged helix-turn-helix domain-containing protein [Phenylobacterium sp.]
MIYRFGASSLDTLKCELRRGDIPIPLEPQVFALLRLLIEHRDRLVSRDEILDRIWGGRIVSDESLASRIKSARRAIGDSGGDQLQIRTLPKLGYRFVAEVEEICGTAPLPRAAATPPGQDAPIEPGPRPSIAVLPFDVVGEPCAQAHLVSGALPQDLITELSRLRWLMVIARGSTFRFRGPDLDIGQVRTALNVRYCLTGRVEVAGRAMTVSVDLCDTGDGGVVWAERYRSSLEDAHAVRGDILRAIVSALDLHIPAHEAARAGLKAPQNLDAWSAYHLGLNHMYRFSRDANGRAAAYFQRAIDLEPSFARAHAGLSFTHFEGAFVHFADDEALATRQAVESAARGLDHDPLDPFCNLVMGRAHWLGGDLDASLPWLDRAAELNPNYAQAKYCRGWTETLMGQAAAGQEQAAAALLLSPLDPLAYGMLGVRALSHIILDEPDQAVVWSERAARAPGAHALIELIAAIGHALNGDMARATPWVRSARRRAPGLTSADFLASFPFRDQPARARICRALETLGV